MKKVLAFIVLGLALIVYIGNSGIESQVLPHDRPMNRYLTDWAGTGELIIIDGNSIDSTNRFPTKPYFNVYLYCAQANDSTSAIIVAKAATYDTAGTFISAYSLPVDTATVTTAGSQFLYWNWSSHQYRNNYSSIDFSAPLTDEIYFVIDTDGDNGLGSQWLLRITGAGE